MRKQFSKEKMAVLEKLSDIIAMRALSDLACAQEKSNNVRKDIEDLRTLQGSISTGGSEIPMITAMTASEKLIRAQERQLLQDHARAEVVRLEALSSARKAEQKRLLLKAVLHQAS